MTNEFSEIEEWKVSYAATDKLITACGDDRMLGGYGVFGKSAVVTKLFKLPPHKAISIKFKLYKIDSWDNHHFFAYVDGT